MTIGNDILNQMPGLGQPQRKFLATLFVTILVLRGRVNFRNLSRYCDDSERTIARQFREPFDWPDFHQRVLRTALDPRVLFQKWRWTEINVTLGLIFVASHRKEWSMTFIAVRCPHCQSDQIVKRGKTARGTQRYLCQNTRCAKGSFLLH